MIDKPHNITEKWLTATTDFMNGFASDTKEILYAGFEPVIKWFKKHKGLFALLLILVIAVISYHGYYELTKIKTVTVVLDDSYGVKTREYETRTYRVDQFLDEQDLNYDKEIDYIDKKIFEPIKDGTVINIIKSYDVYLTVDGQTHTYNSLGVTTQELLDYYGITLGQYDTIDTPMEEHLHALQEVTVVRINIDMVTEQTRLPYSYKFVKNTGLPVGNTEIVQAGVDGIEERDYVCVYRNGEEISKTEMDYRQVQDQQTKIIHYGTKVLKGIPKEVEESAIKVIDNVKAYSYNYSTVRYGVYGYWCSYGTVAVDRKVIPLGSKLYIEGYGYAIANDVGTDIKGNTLDLYMEYRPQTSIWGVKRVKVYILEYGDNSTSWTRPKLDESFKTKEQLTFKK